jgi:hypothetical protein
MEKSVEFPRANVVLGRTKRNHVHLITLHHYRSLAPCAFNSSIIAEDSATRSAPVDQVEIQRIGSFVWCCGMLDLSPSAIRRSLHI